MIVALSSYGLGVALADTDEGLLALNEGRNGDAIQAFQLAFEAGEADAAFYLGRMSELGLGAPADFSSATVFYTAAADGGSPAAKNRLGLMHLNGQGMIQDYEQAHELICAAADAGDANGQFNCASILERGLNGAVAPAKAIEYYRLASEQNHLGAMNLYAFALISGELVVRDVTKGISLVQKTASMGNPVGLFSLGQAYATGLGVDRDPVRAHAYFNLAAARKHPDAPSARAEVEAVMTHDKVIEAQRFARAWRAVAPTNTAPILEEAGDENLSK